jgi:hypothetical protein
MLYGMDPNEGVNGFISMRFTTEEFLEVTGKLADVRDDQVVSALGFGYRSYKYVGNV